MFLTGLAIGLCLPAIRASTLQIDSQESEQCQVTQGAVKSTLDNKEECCLCGSNSRSLMGMYRGKDDLGIISLNNWYVLDMGVGKDTDETISGQNSSRITATGEGGCIFHVDLNQARRISANSHFLRTAGPHFPDSPGHIKRTAWDISRAEGTPPH